MFSARNTSVNLTDSCHFHDPYTLWSMTEKIPIEAGMGVKGIKNPN